MIHYFYFFFIKISRILNEKINFIFSFLVRGRLHTKKSYLERKDPIYCSKLKSKLCTTRSIRDIKEQIYTLSSIHLYNQNKSKLYSEMILRRLKALP